MTVLYIFGEVTEEKIERAVERAFDKTDAMLARGELTQDEYDAASDQIGNEADALYRQHVTPFHHFAGVAR
jgi:uncharacterized membrane protein